MTDSSPSPAIELRLSRQLPVHAETDVLRFFGRFGTVGEHRRPHPYRGPAIDCLVLAAVPLQAFLQNLGTLTGGDAYGAFKSLIKRIRHDESHQHPSKKPDPSIVLQDTNSGLQIVVRFGLPEIAFRQLLELDLHQFNAGQVIFDQDLGCWRAHESGAAAT
jgi:hypothetical protein